MSHRRIVVVTVCVMLSLFMASVEETVVATAMPTIVGQLGGLAIYSWVFSAYMLAATTTIPVFGKLSDIYGRLPIYTVAMGLFLAGSFLSGHAGSMEQLILFRGLQGLGAGALQPLAFIIAGDIFDYKARARVQSLFAGLWGISAIAGPLLGGFLVDHASWHWVFYINLVPGPLALALMWLAWQSKAQTRHRKVQVDWAGAALMSAAIALLLLGLFSFGTTSGWALLALAAVVFAGLLWVERRAADPILPLALLKDRLFAVTVGHSVLSSAAMFGCIAYIPLFVQAVLGTSATTPGATLTPQMLSWTIASMIGSQLLLKMSFRPLCVGGVASLSLGTFLLSRVSADTSQLAVMAAISLMGVGMGLSLPALLIAVQSSIRRDMGAATATIQFGRNLGQTLGVSVTGAALSLHLANNLKAAGFDPNAVPLASLLDRVGTSDVVLETTLRHVLGSSLQLVFLICFGLAVLTLLVTSLAPSGNLAGLAAQRDAREQARLEARAAAAVVATE